MSTRSIRSIRTTMLILGVPLVGLSAAQHTDEPTEPVSLEVVYYDGPMENGQLTGGRVWLPAPDISNLPHVDGGYVTIIDNGPSTNRIDLVTVGDGYLADELGVYEANVLVSLYELFRMEPFATYATFFNAHRVDVVSSESGVDHDPTYPTWRNTALDMGFWCNGIERLLCVDVSAAYTHANAAPDVDQVLAVANSSKYGGAGYTSTIRLPGNILRQQRFVHTSRHS